MTDPIEAGVSAAESVKTEDSGKSGYLECCVLSRGVISGPGVLPFV